MKLQRFSLCACALALSLSASLASAQVLYRETFGRPAGATGNLAVTLADWARFNADGTANSGSGISADGTGKPIDLANVNAGPNIDLTTFDAQPEGWSFQDGSATSTGGGQRLTMTTEFSFNPADHAPNDVVFSWYQGAAQISGVDQIGKLAIRIGSQWYATAQDFTNPPVTSGGNFGLDVGGATQVSYTYNPAASQWLELAFDGDYTPGMTPGTGTVTPSTVAFAVGGNPIADLSGAITAFGIFRPAVGANMRFDTFQIEAVPEPGTFVLAGLGGLGLLIARRRSRR